MGYGGKGIIELINDFMDESITHDELQNIISFST